MAAVAQRCGSTTKALLEVFPTIIDMKFEPLGGDKMVHVLLVESTKILEPECFGILTKHSLDEVDALNHIVKHHDRKFFTFGLICVVVLGRYILTNLVITIKG